MSEQTFERFLAVTLAITFGLALGALVALGF